MEYLPESYKLSDSHAIFKYKIKKELLDKLSACRKFLFKITPPPSRVKWSAPYQVFHPWLRLVLRAWIVPETPCNSISSVSHTVSPLKHTYGMHIAQEHTNLMNSCTSTITHFVEHSTRLYNCKSCILNSINKLVTENDFFSCLSHTY